MDNVKELLSVLQGLRDEMSAIRTESAAGHQETSAKISAMSDRLTVVDARIATMEAKHHGRYRAAGALMVGAVAALARTALLG